MPPPLDGARELLSYAATVIAELGVAHDDGQSSRARLLTKVALEQQRSALDYVAHEVTVRLGDASRADRSQYPLRATRAEFLKEAKGRLPGVGAAYPLVLDAFEQRQPYQPGYDWLDLLTQHVNVAKHRHRLDQSIRAGSEATFVVGDGGWGALEVDLRAPTPKFRAVVDGPDSAVLSRADFVDWFFDDQAGAPTGRVRHVLEQVQGGAEQVVADFSDLLGW